MSLWAKLEELAVIYQSLEYRHLSQLLWIRLISGKNLLEDTMKENVLFIKVMNKIKHQGVNINNE